MAFLIAFLLQLPTAGVCSRCHVAQVLEWSVSKHSKIGTACQNCHGPSAAHVANERNEVKPDNRSPGCASCHAQGCPRTKQTVNCVSCHHNHSLTNPKEAGLRALPDDQRQESFRAHVERGERAIKVEDWKAAKAAFEAALQLYPNHRRAAARLSLAGRRLNPVFPGFEILGGELDSETGLPMRVRVQGLSWEMVLIPGGDLELSNPARSVYVAPFYLARTEFTEDGRMPLQNVSYEDALERIAKINQRISGGGFGLPSEIEWEFAARGSAPSWFRSAGSTTAGDAHPVGQKRASTLGLFDMLGNVAEWTSSIAPSGLRILKGGSYADSVEYLIPSLTHSERANRRQPWNGFRLARHM